MAQMPRRMPSSQQQRTNGPIKADGLKAWLEQGSWPASPFSPFPNRVAARYARAPGTSVTSVGGRLVCVDPPKGPALSPAEQEERRRAIVRALFMADHPLGAAAYGLATLAHASPGARDAALAGGGVIDASLGGAAPFGAQVRGRMPPPKPLTRPPPEAREPIRLREFNRDGQATGATATLSPRMLRTGTKPDRGLTPPGWRGNGRDHNEARGHLIAAQLGGSGSDARNIVTLTQSRTNNPYMRTFEDAVARRVRSGEIIEYSSTPLYDAGALAPQGILLTAFGSRGAPTARYVDNPAGRRK